MSLDEIERAKTKARMDAAESAMLHLNAKVDTNIPRLEARRIAVDPVRESFAPRVDRSSVTSPEEQEQMAREAETRDRERDTLDEGEIPSLDDQIRTYKPEEQVDFREQELPPELSPDTPPPTKEEQFETELKAKAHESVEKYLEKPRHEREKEMLSESERKAREQRKEITRLEKTRDRLQKKRDQEAIAQFLATGQQTEPKLTTSDEQIIQRAREAEIRRQKGNLKKQLSARTPAGPMRSNVGEMVDKMNYQQLEEAQARMDAWRQAEKAHKEEQKKKERRELEYQRRVADVKRVMRGQPEDPDLVLSVRPKGEPDKFVDVGDI